jgi:hypothetical protein
MAIRSARSIKYTKNDCKLSIILFLMLIRKKNLRQKRNTSFIIPAAAPQPDHFVIQNVPVRRKVSRFEVITLPNVTVVSEKETQQLGEPSQPPSNSTVSPFALESDGKLEVTI